MMPGTESIPDRLAHIKARVEYNLGLSPEDARFINDLLWRYKKALEGLTPGGSEFVNDPERCAEFVRERSRGLIRAMAEQKRRLAR